jgi:hypothetical protein
MKITNNTYSFVENATVNDEWHIKINEGTYSGVVYKYGQIKIIENDDHASLKFQYNIVDLPEHLDEEELKCSVDFMDMLGDVLTHIITDSFETGKFKLGNNDKPIDSKSTVHE